MAYNCYQILQRKKSLKTAFFICVIYFLLFSQLKCSCPNSTTTTTSILTQQFSTNPSCSSVILIGITAGPVSNSLYYQLNLNCISGTALRKVNQNNIEEWITTVTFDLSSRSLSISQSEKILCQAGGWYISVFCLNANDGSVYSSQYL